jgi:eukaryotic-like serine/threonine-protein kinase
MSLGPGTRLGPYEIVSAIGAGGMGEVYRARDTKLGRDVAIKVLPALVTGDPDRLARFQREAQVLAALNHPNIAAIHHIEETSDGPALVMELVEGETLADRIAHGPIPIDEALPIAKQIAEALETAHDQGIIHRDLKPANIKVRPDGTVKVLDFGLAKLAERSGAIASTDVSPLSLSPTITSPALMTGVGVLLGTAAYMSPEQAKGKPADKRSDIWAFGCVVYEMLAGKRAFEGEDVADTLAAVLRGGEPDWSALPRTLPAPVRVVLQQCLARDRRQRISDISTPLFVLNRAADLTAGDGEGRVPSDPRTLPGVRSWMRRRSTVAAIAAAAVASLATGFAVWRITRSSTTVPARAVTFQIPTPGNAPAEMLSLSPDGGYLAFVANAGGPNQIWMRPLDASAARPLAGTDGATYPFWSPDSTTVGFFAQGKLKKVAIRGTPPQTVCDAPDGRGGTWNRDGLILFSPGPADGLQRVAAAGGVPTVLTKLADASEGHRFPVFLPDGVHFLFNVSSNSAARSGVWVGSIDGSGAARVLPDATNALYTPAKAGEQNGYLVFRRETTLVAQPFNPVTLQTTGEVVPIVEEVPVSGNNGFGAFSVGQNGTVLYRTGGSAAQRDLAWVDTTGSRLKSTAAPRLFSGRPALSPDGGIAAVSISNGDEAAIWLHEVDRGVLTRLSFNPGIARYPVWSPDGSRVAFSFQQGTSGVFDIYEKPASGSRQETLLVKGGINTILEDWSSDGKWLVYRQTGSPTALDLWLLPLEGDRKPVVYLQTPFSETGARFAPAGGAAPKWMAYASNESGQYQVYIQEIPATGAKYQVSTNGGTLPMWRADAKQLYYLSPDQKVIAVDVTLGTSARLGQSRDLFASPGVTGYTPSADGKRFLVNVPAGGQAAAAPPLTVVLNWPATLKQ